MKYQEEIIGRLTSGLAAVATFNEVQDFSRSFAEPQSDLKTLVTKVNNHYNGLLVAHGQNPIENIEELVPENNDAIVYWIEDLEEAVLPRLKEDK